MNTERLNDELTITGLIFIFLVLVPLMCIKILKVENELNQAKTIAVELHEESNLAYEMVESLNKELDLAGEYINHKKLLKDLSQIKSNKDLTVVVCFTESSFRYNAKHTGWYNEGITGHVCGLKDHWVDIIPELNQDNINTISRWKVGLSCNIGNIKRLISLIELKQINSELIDYIDGLEYKDSIN